MTGPLRTVPWYGGKTLVLPWLLPLLRVRPPPALFVDLFGGSAAVIVNRPRTRTEIYNDLDDGIVALFRALRDHPDELIRRIRLTPYARTEYVAAFQPAPDDPIEHARRVWVQCRQGFAGGGGHRDTTGNWARAFGREKSHAYSSRTAADQLHLVAERLRAVTIENTCGLALFAHRRIVDNPDALVYIDPPYALETRSGGDRYRHDDVDHDALLALCARARCHVAISGYRTALYDRVLAGWRRHDRRARVTASTGHGWAAESCWTNYDPAP